MKVIVNKPAPAPTPPTTYNLTDLSIAEARAIRHALFNLWYRSDKNSFLGDHAAAHTVWSTLSSALFGVE